jgi:hypothetical protein
MISFVFMKNREQLLKDHFAELPKLDLGLYIEMAEKAEKSGDKKTSIYWYTNGFEKAKQLKDRSRIQQFSNILCSVL